MDMSPPLFLSVIEFYSGIGGLSHGFLNAIQRLGIQGQINMAFDINQHANSIHRLNLPTIPISTQSILTLDVSHLSQLNANVWLLSPPCQPYTRQGKQQGAIDPRSKSFLSMIHLLPSIPTSLRPIYILIENVLGFERDPHTFGTVIHVLKQCGYYVQCFAPVNPIHLLGIPNSRPRLFLLARSNLPFPQTDNNNNNETNKQDTNSSNNNHNTIIPITNPSCLLSNQYHNNMNDSSSLLPLLSFPSTLSHYLRNDVIHLPPNQLYLTRCDLWRIPAHKFDVVWCNDKRTCCFTKGYGSKSGRPQASGSILVTNSELTHTDWINACTIYINQRLFVLKQIDTLVNEKLQLILSPNQFNKVLQQQQQQQDQQLSSSSLLQGSLIKKINQVRSQVWSQFDAPECPLEKFGLRYFAPKEITNLLGFPNDFKLPESITTQQGWRLVGNSVNVAVVQLLVEYLLTEK